MFISPGKLTVTPAMPLLILVGRRGEKHTHATSLMLMVDMIDGRALKLTIDASRLRLRTINTRLFHTNISS